MRERVHNSRNLIYPVGAQVVTRKTVQGSHGRIAHASGAVGGIVKSPMDWQNTSEKSHLPERPTGKDALNDLLIRLRLNGFGKAQDEHQHS